MSDFFYFLSYARPDRDEDSYDCIRRFRTELEQEVRRIKGPTEGRIGFFDGEDIKSGDAWPDTLSEALCTSRVFVPIYSQTYFTKDYCGREWKIFRDRLEAYKTQYPDAEVENLIQPVLLVPPDRLSLPDPVSHIQYLYDRYPEDYQMEGLHVISRVGVYRDSYERFKTVLARRIVDVADKYPLPPLSPCPDIRETRSAFAVDQPGKEVFDITGISETVGPRHVQFVVVAGKREELEKIRHGTDCYGSVGGVDWRPFLPEVTNEVALVAQEIAAEEKLFSQIIPLDVGIMQRLADAEQDHKIVVIIVDPWTLNLPRYRTLMHILDERDFLNCVVLVLWNLRDNETLLKRPSLETTLLETFPNKWIAGDPNRFLHSIDSPDELKKQLSQTLQKARARIVLQMEVAKRAKSPQ